MSLRIYSDELLFFGRVVCDWARFLCPEVLDDARVAKYVAGRRQ
jgi:hypothetical protein